MLRHHEESILSVSHGGSVKEKFLSNTIYRIKFKPRKLIKQKEENTCERLVRWCF